MISSIPSFWFLITEHAGSDPDSEPISAMITPAKPGTQLVPCSEKSDYSSFVIRGMMEEELCREELDFLTRDWKKWLKIWKSETGDDQCSAVAGLTETILTRVTGVIILVENQPKGISIIQNQFHYQECN